MCNKANDNYAHALELFLDRYKTQETCIKSFDNYPSTIKCVPDQYKNQEMCIRAVNICSFVSDSVND